MNININSGKDIIKEIRNETLKPSCIKEILQEGRTFNARILAKEDDIVLLKAGSYVFPVKLQNEISTENDLRIVVEKVTSDKIHLNKISEENDFNKINSLFPKIRLLFMINSSEKNEQLLTLIGRNQNFKAKIINYDRDIVTLKNGEDLIQATPKILRFDTNNRNLNLVRFKDEPFLYYFIKEQKTVGFLGESKEIRNPDVNNYFPTRNKEIPAEQYSKILKDFLINDQKTLLNNPEIILKSYPAANEAIISDFQSPVKAAFANSAEKEDFFLFKTIKNLFFEIQKMPSSVSLEQKDLSLSGIVFDPKSGYLKGYIDNKEYLLRPFIEFAEDKQIIFKMTDKSKKSSLIMDVAESIKLEESIKKNISLLGEHFADDEKTEDIFRALMESKISLNKDNIKTIRDFLNYFPLDTKTGIDLMLNQNLLLGLYYRFIENNDYFLFKSFYKDNENKPGRGFEFKIVYKSEKLGTILIDIKLLSFLSIIFYCENDHTKNIINNSLADLQTKIGFEKVIIKAEHIKNKIIEEKSEDSTVYSGVDFKI